MLHEKQQTKQHIYVPAREVHNFHEKARTLNVKDQTGLDELRKLGFGFDSMEHLHAAYKAHGGKVAMDMDVYPTQTTASFTTPIQFLQSWLPGYIYIMTAPRLIDELVGIATVGEWSSEQVVRMGIEGTSNARPYSDYSQVPFTDYNTNFIQRSIVRFEEGMRVGRLTQARSAAINIDESRIKREFALQQLEIIRNYTGFFGFNGGNNLTYGLLNDPNLPAYVAFPNGAAGGSTWATKTYLEIQSDLLTLFKNLATGSNGLIDPKRVNCTLALPIAASQYLSTTSQFGNSVENWLNQNYPKVRIVHSVPQFDGANGGANVCYLYADNVNDSSTDGGATFYQAVPTKMMTVGVEQQAKAYVEDYANATAGVMLQRPYAVVRGSGL